MEMTVGAAAKAVGVSAKAVRLWEAKGLLLPAERTDSGYRVFTDDDLDVLRFIRKAKALDLTLSEIKDIIDLQRGGATPCARVTRSSTAISPTSTAPWPICTTSGTP